MNISIKFHFTDKYLIGLACNQRSAMFRVAGNYQRENQSCARNLISIKTIKRKTILKQKKTRQALPSMEITLRTFAIVSHRFILFPIFYS